jgi:hypothetical protein
MKSSEEFQSFYNTQLLPELDILEVMRKEQLKFIKKVIALIVGSLLLFVLFAQILGPELISILVPLVLLVGGLIYLFTKEKPKVNYNSEFKNRLIRNIIKFISPELSYSPTKHISQSDFDRSRLFLTRIDRYNGDDYVEGKIDRTMLHFSELHAQVKRQSGGKNKSETWHDVFKGLFFIADFNKDFSGSTVLIPNYFGKGNSWFKKLFGVNRREKLVKLEDPEFANNFNCYSDDDVKARYILSPALMSRISKFKLKYPKNPVHISFVDSHMYVAIAYTKDLFEPPFFKTVKNFELVKSYFEDIKFVVEIVEEFNLNTRIWTKE